MRKDDEVYVIFDDFPVTTDAFVQKNNLKKLNEKTQKYIQTVGSSIKRVISMYYRSVKLVENQKISHFIKSMLSASGFPILSISPILNSGNNVVELRLSRFQKQTPHENNYQFIGHFFIREDIKPYLINSDTVNIFDDVIFSGKTISVVIDALYNNKIKINTIYTNIITEKAYNELTEKNINVVYQNKYANSINIVCTRDFIFGAPDGGMKVAKERDATHYFASYFYPFGDAHKWASIPRKMIYHFSFHISKISYKLWKMLEVQNNRYLSLDDLERKPALWNASTENISEGLLDIMHHTMKKETDSSRLHRRLVFDMVKAVWKGAELIKEYQRDRQDRKEEVFTIEKPTPSGFLKDFQAQIEVKVETIIQEYLVENYPCIKLIGEENSNASAAIVPSINSYFLLDPIDGTTNFIANRDYYAISLAYVEDGKPHIGVIMNPVTGQIVFAVSGKGCYNLSSHNSKPIRCYAIQDKPLNLLQIDCELPMTSNDEIHLVQKITKNCLGMRKYGSTALDIASMSTGRHSALIANYLKPHDIGAGIVIARESGLLVTNWKGEHVDLNNSNIVVANPFAHPEIIDLLKNSIND